ncbi:MAG: hypothetical protein G3M78_13880 [Candidatus Nitrohelix vancouverensis]|uniref:Leucine Rich repeats (2 copies) n=1 Tax=Candidatus Nitrohelix vancouverensis TaxID=2705534 RepID=A0A7T0C4L6_9BACT|nr:MAG: hypothetical protein G3M78_13880 [Candidatus Nitrohelix vancouverensis]
MASRLRFSYVWLSLAFVFFVASFAQAAVKEEIDYQSLFDSQLKRNGKFLDLNGKKIGDEGVRFLIGSPVIAGLEKLDLRYNDLSAEGARLLSSAQFPKLKKLILRHNILGDAGALEVAASSGFPVLEELQLNWAEVRDEGALAFAENRDRFPRLKKLDLRGNFLSGDTKETLKQKLSYLKSLELY